MEQLMCPMMLRFEAINAEECGPPLYIYYYTFILNIEFLSTSLECGLQ